MLTALDNYHWAEAFADNSSGNTTKEIEAYGCSEASFTREDVAEILAIDEHFGAYAETNVAGVFLLKDGRYAVVTGWCDTTGWDCQAGNCLTVAADIETALAMGLAESYGNFIDVEAIKAKEARRPLHPDLRPFADKIGTSLHIGDPQHPDLSPYSTAL